MKKKMKNEKKKKNNEKMKNAKKGGGLGLGEVTSPFPPKPVTCLGFGFVSPAHPSLLSPLPSPGRSFFFFSFFFFLSFFKKFWGRVEFGQGGYYLPKPKPIGGILGSYALSCSLLPLSLLLNSLGVHLMLILMLRTRHVDAERLIWLSRVLVGCGLRARLF